MVSSDQPVKAVNHTIFMIFTAIQSCSAPLYHAASFGAVLRAGGAETSATEQAAVHRPLPLLAGSRSSGGKEEMQQDLGKGLAPLRNLPHCRQMCQASPFHIK